MAFSTVTGERLTHMSDGDVVVWDRWLSKHRGEDFSCDYDVSVGDGRDPAGFTSPWDRALWRALTVKRIDVVVTVPGGLLLVEVKPVLNMSGLGQILGYLHLYKCDHPGALRVSPVLVCGKTDPELEPVYASNSIRVEIV